MEPDKFFKKFAKYAIFNHLLYGVPASITLSQAAIESNFGKSKLASLGNNYFGIKAYNNPRNLPVIFANDDKPNEPFRAYKTPFKSFLDHSIFLNENQRYFDCFGKTPDGWADCLQQKGYATNQNYANQLKTIINKYGLKKYDKIGNNRFLILVFILIIIAGLIYLLINKIK